MDDAEMEESDNIIDDRVMCPKDPDNLEIWAKISKMMHLYFEGYI